LIEPPAGQEAPAAPGAGEPEEEVVAPALPSFDIVRVDRTGYAVIAGRAAPGAKVTIYANDEPLAETTAEGDGSWVIATETPLESGSVELSLEMTTDDGGTIRSDQTIIIYVPQREGDRPLVLRTTPGGATEVLQEPRDDGVGMGPLSLETIDYDEQGAVIFAGRAEADRVVQLFANGQFVGQTTAGADGRWRLTATMPPGVYTLHVIQLDESGRPAYAIELPFERASLSDIELRDGKVIVQPGNSLWRIARRAYGRGIQYTVIYEANADQIRDPDLIYPGQIFDVPEPAEEEPGE
ncbi:MAG TPA: LysM peptidoglycan-binding domain-containing protein, partial [Parvularculaceae bacterium]|nr:LysM peptidoglycan-binding domain-containing protein [Parvularculaceae bacterium]